jgi:hypothetical protein
MRLMQAQFCDPSLATAASRAGPAQLLKDLNYFGYLFEASGEAGSASRPPPWLKPSIVALP